MLLGQEQCNMLQLYWQQSHNSYNASKMAYKVCMCEWSAEHHTCPSPSRILEFMLSAFNVQTCHTGVHIFLYHWIIVLPHTQIFGPAFHHICGYCMNCINSTQHLNSNAIPMDTTGMITEWTSPNFVITLTLRFIINHYPSLLVSLPNR